MMREIEGARSSNFWSCGNSEQAGLALRFCGGAGLKVATLRARVDAEAIDRIRAGNLACPNYRRCRTWPVGVNRRLSVARGKWRGLVPA
jgi:hypothetical protein